jgi:thymidine phosphorylase
VSGLSIDAILETKRDGGALSEAQIQAFIDGLLSEQVTRAQAAAWLAMVFTRGMTDSETVSLTRIMTDSGDRLSWPGLDGPFVDKHSTGGVGDKVSLVLAPLWVALGCRVPMISGRGLGHTGGTLDKLESIPGFRTDLQPAELRTVLETAGGFISGQTGDVAPADRVLYALRNETSTVPSIPLITASILSKKLAEGIDTLSLDVKWGSGAFMKTREDAEALARSLVAVGNGAGVQTRARITDMNQPLGLTVGNAIEVEEAVACLKGEGPEDLASLTCDLIGDPRAREVLDSGAAYAHWCRMVEAQGGDPAAPLLGGGCTEAVVASPRSGVIERCDAYEIGRAAFVLGAGRLRAKDPVHFGVGVRVHAKVGDRVEAGQPLVTLLHDEARGLEQAQAHVEAAIEFQGDD